MNETNFDEFILERMPHFIAVNYQRLLETRTARERVEQALRIYNLGLRALTISIVSQYLTRDREVVSDPDLNELLLLKFPRLTADAWQQLLFAALRAYEGKQDRFFVPELYDFYWDSTELPHRQRVDVEQLFSRLTLILVELSTEQWRPQIEAEWEKLAKETEDLLELVLRKLKFIGDYSFIRIMDYDEVSYDFELHKGLQVSVEHQPLPEHIELNRGCFYLRDKTGDLLLLHPLLVFWQEKSGESELVSIDTGVYDRFFYQRLYYTLATGGRRVVEDKSVKIFVEMFYDTIQKGKSRHEQVDKLTWSKLRDVCADITQGQMAAVGDEDKKKLRLQRDKARQAFERFLKSDKRCFVLTGRSGVGKSNFLLALGEELRSNSNICVLMYGGGSLKVEPSITSVISRDFDKRLNFANRQVQDVWREITQIEGINERLFIFCVDALNENPQAKELLKQLDELVQGPWPWLKLVFTSRPETWQTIKGGIRLAEARYYREEGSEASEVRLEPFSRRELFEAYAKYKQVYKLQTGYEALQGELRELVKEPLNLYFVARTYQGKAIPDTLKVTELVDMYVQALLQSGRLQREDLQLLEKQLVPLMNKSGHYGNTIMDADIDAAGSGLFATIYSDQVLSDGRRMNQSFVNLLDAEILIRQREGFEQRLAFKYERFYEYFMGRRFSKQLGSEDMGEEQYKEWIAQLPKSPYLWGAIKSCLEQQMRELQTEECAMLCMRLAHIPDNRMAEILTAALTEYGGDDIDKVHSIVKYMLKQEQGRLRSILRREAAAAQCPTWKHVGIEVASNLKLGMSLESALADPSSAVRAVAIRHAFIYWKHERVAGFKLLESLMSRSTGLLGLPDPGILESSVGFSLMILFDDFRNTETTTRLRQAWQHTVERLLRVTPQGLSGRRERIKTWVRTALLQIVTGFVVRAASTVPPNSLLSIPELTLFFKHDEDLDRRRVIAHKLISFMDVETTDLRDVRDDVLGLVAERDMFIAWLATVMLRRHTAAHPEVALPLLKDLFDQAIKVNPPGPFSGYVPVCALPLERDYGLHKNTVLSLLVYMCTTYLDRFQGECWSKLQRRRQTHLDALCFAEAGGIVDVSLTPTAKRFMDKMIAEKDYAWISDVVRWEVSLEAVERGYLRFAFSVIEMLVGIQELSITELVIELLARVRVYHPDEVDDFMEVNNMDEQSIKTVRTRTSSETIGDLLGLRALIFWTETIERGGAPEVWHRLTWLFEQLPKCRSLEQWLTLSVKVIVNEIYGGPVFAGVATPAP